jgi:toxin FitB
MNYLLDTMAVSEAVKSRTNSGYMEWLNATGDDRIYISCLTIGEIQKGLALADKQALKFDADKYMRGLLDAFAGRVLELAAEDCLLWGELFAKAGRAGKTPPVVDALIAAQCLQHHLTLVTRNVKDFEQFAGLRVFCPWS